MYQGVTGYHSQIYFFSLKIAFVLANSVDPDEMSHYTAFHLGLHCLPKYMFRVYYSIQRVKKGKIEELFYLVKCQVNSPAIVI